ncbi:MAG: hypothetical protein EOP56_17225 [Sphingobacteriales bacterium]|nr:MAG: hypothetical protein EOP56_17225 [Sphingobacteriales bacterium]
MRKLSFIILLLTTLVLRAGAQTFYTSTEYGFSAGASQYFGDINDNYGFKFVRPAGGLFVRKLINPFIAIRGSVAYTHVGYADKYSSNYFNKTRNLSFESDIIEVVAQSEFNFFRFSTGELNSRFTPYLTAGIGAFYYNPYTDYLGRRYNLRSMGTEGQYLEGYEGRQYGRVSVCFPVGAGIKYWVVPGVNFGFEIANRLTLTDYMDDVSTTYVGASNFPTDPQIVNPAFVLQDRSPEITGIPLGRAGKQRGNTNTKDQYMMFMFNISIQLKTYKCPAFLKEGYYMY